MVLKNLMDILDKISPFELQDSWDNSGLCVGDEDQKVDKIYLSLDADLELIKKIEPNSLLIVHHPPIFKALKTITNSSYPSKFLREAIKKDIAIVSMHTNYDISHLNQYVLEEVLGYDILKRDGYVLYFDVDRSFDAFASDLAYKLNIEKIRVVKKNDWINIAAITTGSGSELVNSIKADCFITGDIKYHVAKEAFENSLSLIDIQHYESEIFFAQSLQRELENYGLFGIIANSKNPFSYISKDIHE